MTLTDASRFLSATETDNSRPSVWVDLGCGDGLFSQVLSSRLCGGSTIYAIDKTDQYNIDSINKEVKIVFRKADFVNDDLQLQNVHGILMANALHYVEDKVSLLQKLKRYLLPEAMFIIIEYDNAKANRWVPYPISFTQLTELFAKEGYHHILKTGERKSIYQSGNMYVCSVKP